MPNSINVPTPPMFSGDTENKIRQVHTYLYRLSEQLALILNSIEATGTQIVQSGSAASSSGDIYAIRDQLKQLIVNTTATLRQEMAEAIEASMPILRSGTAMCTKALAGGQHEDIAVTFDAMPAAPVVTVSLIGGDDGEHGGNVSCRIISGTITESGFTVRVTSSTGQEAAHNYGVAWMAVAEGGQDGNTDE